MYIYQQEDWPNFLFDYKRIAQPLQQLIAKEAQLRASVNTLQPDSIMHTEADALTAELISSFAIEDAKLDGDQIRSSVLRHLGAHSAELIQTSRSSEGIAAMMMDAVKNCSRPLTEDRLLNWHRSIFPDGHKTLYNLKTGCWRATEMQVVSGAVGHFKVHFEAVPAAAVQDEMQRFLQWINHEDAEFTVIKAAIAHLWFVTIHPFEDGNGRIARAITEMLLAQASGGSKFYSVSQEILKSKEAYYRILEQTQKGDLNVTDWILWFISCIEKALSTADAQLAQTLNKAEFWRLHAQLPLNERQRCGLNALLDGLESISSGKWAELGRCSQDTALSDLKKLTALGLLERSRSGGRSTRYRLMLHKAAKP